MLPEEDNKLKACGDGRKAALDLRLLGLPMTDPGKIETAAERITDLWHAHCDDTYPGPDGRDSPIRGSLQLAHFACHGMQISARDRCAVEHQ